MQCPAVKTCLSVKTEPPQKWPPRRVMETIQGNSLSLASCPPTIFPMRLVEWILPHSTSATSTTNYESNTKLLFSLNLQLCSNSTSFTNKNVKKPKIISRLDMLILLDAGQWTWMNFVSDAFWFYRWVIAVGTNPTFCWWWSRVDLQWIHWNSIAAW